MQVPDADMDDMFADVADDMFAAEENVAAGQAGDGVKRATALADAYDDHEGYYNFQVWTSVCSIVIIA